MQLFSLNKKGFFEKIKKRRVKIQGNIKKYCLYQFFHSLAFFSPVIVLFWQSKGLNMTQIMTLQSIYGIGVVILELPTGAFADYFGKKSSLILGALFSAFAFFVYGLSFKFWQFAIGEIICSTGMAFVSGADRAFIHESLKSQGRKSEYKKIEGGVRGLNQMAQTIGNLLGGIIGSISLGLTLIASGISSFIAFLFGLSFSFLGPFWNFYGYESNFGFRQSLSSYSFRKGSHDPFFSKLN